MCPHFCLQTKQTDGVTGLLVVENYWRVNQSSSLMDGDLERPKILIFGVSKKLLAKSGMQHVCVIKQSVSRVQSPKLTVIKKRWRP